MQSATFCCANSMKSILKRSSFFHYISLVSAKEFRLSSSLCKAKSHSCGELRTEHVGQEVALCGWLQFLRRGPLFTLRDAEGVTQIVAPDEQLDMIKKTSKESVLQVLGTVEHRKEGEANPNMATGHIEVVANEIKLLNPAVNTLPFQVHGHIKVNETQRFRYRYLDMRREEVQHNLRFRSNFIFKMREFLCNQHKFVDVETPNLFGCTPGGAREFKVPTRFPGKYYSLPQSPQQFKQLLMVGGIDRYMQIARCFRDENVRPERQPEFTQLDLEMSFVDKDDIEEVVEKLLCHCWPGDRTKLTIPFPRMKYADAMANFGSDKPDTRFGMQLCDISKLVADCGIDKISKPAKEGDCSVQSVVFKQVAKYISKNDIASLPKVMGEVPGLWYAVVKVKEDGDWQGNWGPKLGEEVYRSLRDRLGTESGDLFIITAGKHTEACTYAGRFRTKIADLLETKGHNVRGDEKQMNFLWIEDFPLFLPKEDGSEGLESAHHPFTAPYPGDEELLKTSPEQVRSQHYDLVLNGAEIGGGSIRIHNAQLQRYILTEILGEESTSLEHLLTALDFGCPPHGGIALGLDRLVAILCGARSIKEVIAFPKARDGSDFMTDAPGPISDEDKDYYHLPK